MRRTPYAVVTIFEDPITRELAEGTARLIRKVAVVNDDGYEHWDVDFGDGHGSCRRTIHVSQIKGHVGHTTDF